MIICLSDSQLDADVIKIIPRTMNRQQQKHFVDKMITSYTWYIIDL